MAHSDSKQQQSVGAVAETGGASGSYSNSAITMVGGTGEPLPGSSGEQILAAKISRAMLSGPRHITKDATVAEMDAQGNLVVLRQGTNHWVASPATRTKSATSPCALILMVCSG